MAIKAREEFDSQRSVTSRHRQTLRLQVVERHTSFSNEKEKVSHVTERNVTERNGRASHELLE